MSVDPIWIFFGGAILAIAFLWGTHQLDERRWAREEKRREEWERTHPAE